MVRNKRLRAVIIAGCALAVVAAVGVGVAFALEAQQLLRDDWGVIADVWSVTSWTELRRDGLAADEVAAAAGTISYELFCALAPRVPVSVRGAGA